MKYSHSHASLKLIIWSSERPKRSVGVLSVLIITCKSCKRWGEVTILILSQITPLVYDTAPSQLVSLEYNDTPNKVSLMPNYGKNLDFLPKLK